MEDSLRAGIVEADNDNDVPLGKQWTAMLDQYCLYMDVKRAEAALVRQGCLEFDRRGRLPPPEFKAMMRVLLELEQRRGIRPVPN